MLLTNSKKIIFSDLETFLASFLYSQKVVDLGTKLAMLTIGNVNRVVAAAKALYKDIRTWREEPEFMGN